MSGGGRRCHAVDRSNLEEGNLSGYSLTYIKKFRKRKERCRKYYEISRYVNCTRCISDVSFKTDSVVDSKPRPDDRVNQWVVRPGIQIRTYLGRKDKVKSTPYHQHFVGRTYPKYQQKRSGITSLLI
jgi:hypothetical protein